MAPRVGFEPTTLRLTAECSTTELSRNSSYNYFIITYLFGIWQPLTFPGSFPPSIISRLCLNQPVRNGKGCVPQTHHHQKFLKAFFYTFKTKHRVSSSIEFCQHFIDWTLLGQVLDLLVLVSWTRYRAYTSNLSTLESSRGLTCLRNGKSYLKGGFTLRCLQRLSVPYIATRLCSWSATGTPEVCPSRSSRTKDSSSQISCAHNG